MRCDDNYTAALTNADNGALERPLGLVDLAHTIALRHDEIRVRTEQRIGIELAYDVQRVDRRSRNSAFSANNANHSGSANRTRARTNITTDARAAIKMTMARVAMPGSRRLFP